MQNTRVLYKIWLIYCQLSGTETGPRPNICREKLSEPLNAHELATQLHGWHAPSSPWTHTPSCCPKTRASSINESAAGNRPQQMYYFLLFVWLKTTVSSCFRKLLKLFFNMYLWGVFFLRFMSSAGTNELAEPQTGIQGGAYKHVFLDLYMTFVLP